MDSTVTKVLMPLDSGAQAGYEGFGLTAEEKLEVVHIEPDGEPPQLSQTQ